MIRFAEIAEDTDLSEVGISILELVKRAGFADSNSAAKRLMQNGGFRVDNVKITDTEARVFFHEGKLFLVSKKVG